MMLHWMALSTGPKAVWEGRVSPVNFEGVVGIWKEIWVGRDGGSTGTKWVGNPEGGFGTSHNEKSVARVVWMIGGVGCDGRTGVTKNRWLRCSPL